MEKRGVVEPGRTPPEDDSQKTAAENLENHPLRRVADATQHTLGGLASEEAVLARLGLDPKAE